MKLIFPEKLFYRVVILICSILLFVIPFNNLFSQDTLNVIKNGQFDTSKVNWYLKSKISSGAGCFASDSSILSGKNSLKIEIIDGSDSLKDVCLFQSIPMETNRYYSISFMAVSNSAAKIQPAFNAKSTASNIIWTGPVTEVSNKPKHFGPYIFKNLNPDAIRAFSLLMGGQKNLIIWLDSIVVNRIDDPETERPEEVLQKALVNLIPGTENKFLKLNFESMLEVLNAKYKTSAENYALLSDLSFAFTDPNMPNSPTTLTPYLQRKRPLIVSWISPTDGQLSFAWLLLPNNWDPEKTYPLYVMLHGLWPVAENPIYYLSIYLAYDYYENEPFDDGYELLPWGRGNLWYEGIAETDIFESVEKIESLVKVDKSRKYITGFSMGGYGAWKVCQKSPETWAALGVYAGSLDYSNSKMLDSKITAKLKYTPSYFVVGTSDGFLSIVKNAHDLLKAAGNQDLVFTTFAGGHDYTYDNLKNMNEWLKQWKKDSLTSVESLQGRAGFNKPGDFKLFDNYPNPFNPATTIRYQLPAAGKFTLKVYDLLGREVIKLVDDLIKQGSYNILWNGKDSSGNEVSSGVYFCKITYNEKTITKKMMLMR